MIYTVTLNPALDKTIEITDFKTNCVNRVERARVDAGGKGINVSRIVNMLGTDTLALGILGGHSGQLIIDKLKKEGIKNSFLTTDTATRTNTKIVDYKNNTYTDINERGILKDKGAIERLMAPLLEKATPDDVVVLSGSLPDGADADTYNRWIKLLNQKGIKVFFDADKSALKSGIEAKPYFIKPNIDEFSCALEQDFKTLIDIKVCAQELIKNGIKKVAVTLGEGGSILVSENGAYYANPLNIEVKSTVGAGDSFLAAVAFCEQSGKSDAETLKFAAAVSTAKVMCEGTSAPDKPVIEELLGKIVIEKI